MFSRGFAALQAGQLQLALTRLATAARLSPRDARYRAIMDARSPLGADTPSRRGRTPDSGQTGTVQPNVSHDAGGIVF